MDRPSWQRRKLISMSIPKCGPSSVCSATVASRGIHLVVKRHKSMPPALYPTHNFLLIDFLHYSWLMLVHSRETLLGSTSTSPSHVPQFTRLFSLYIYMFSDF